MADLERGLGMASVCAGASRYRFVFTSYGRGLGSQTSRAETICDGRFDEFSYFFLLLPFMKGFSFKGRRWEAQ